MDVGACEAIPKVAKVPVPDLGLKPNPLRDFLHGHICESQHPLSKRNGIPWTSERFHDSGGFVLTV
jgi:hypothetical protein